MADPTLVAVVSLSAAALIRILWREILALIVICGLAVIIACVLVVLRGVDPLLGG